MTSQPHAGAATSADRALHGELLSDDGHGFWGECGLQGVGAFQCKDFARVLFETVARERNAEPVIIGVRDGNGEPLALFVFIRRRRMGVSVIEALDFNVTDYFAPLYFSPVPPTAQRSAEIWRAVLAVLPPADAVAFKKMPRLLHGRPHALSGATFAKPMATSSASLPLRDAAGARISADDHPLGRDVRRKIRKLEAHGEVTLLLARTPAEIDEAMDKLITFRRARFGELGRADELLNPDVEAFYRTLASGNEGEPLGRLLVLRAGSETVAVIYGLCADGVFTLLIPAIAPEPQWQAGSPGTVALFLAMKWCLERDYRVFDLSIGPMHYKSRFRATEVELFEFQQALTPLGVIVVAEGWARRQIRHLVRRRPATREALTRLDNFLRRSMLRRVADRV
jgi:CelD/BcsL family acetyltransferase involved in cellulose biosynthesis